MRTLLYGAQSDQLRPELAKHPSLKIVDTDPEVIICFGGDGTLLSAELAWPMVPKLPIRNSRRGIRCIPHPPAEVIRHLVENMLAPTRFLKLECAISYQDEPDPMCFLTAMNEFNVHMGHINSAVRFRVWIDEAPYENGAEILGDGFVVCTPFGSTAYFNQITHGVFHSGLGLAFKATSEHTNHIIVPESATVRVRITRGPAVLAFDNAPEYFELCEGDELTIHKSLTLATVLTMNTIHHPFDSF